MTINLNINLCPVVQNIISFVDDSFSVLIGIKSSKCADILCLKKNPRRFSHLFFGGGGGGGGMHFSIQ